MTFEEFAESVIEIEELRKALAELRGGCSCHISPPCFACSEPLTLEEAYYLGWEEPLVRPTKMRDWRLT